MKRILIVYNPSSSRYADVKREVLDKCRGVSGCMVGKYKIEKTDVDKNAAKLAECLEDGDLVVAAGGDATGAIAVNAIMNTDKDVTLTVLPYGNFNDLSRTLGTRNIESIPCRSGKLYPLDILVDGEHFRYATCYVTVGMTAEAVKLYDTPNMRRQLKTKIGRAIGSYTALAGWYFKNRKNKEFLPDFKLNGVMQPKGTSDYAAVNGRYMARVMKGGDDYRKPKVFRSETDRLTKFWRLFKLMVKSIFVRVPGAETKGDSLEFMKPATVELQAEGEYRVLENIKKIEVRKAEKCLKVIEL